ncbi:MAG: DUF3754 domain-containing protein [Planctomycetes bacterium]|nr:DUF3754 domain-containing protein [Planctomycetota bacterium]
MTAAHPPTTGDLPLPQPSEVECPPVVAAAAGREHFIPIRRSELVELLAGQPELSPTERDQFLQLARLLEATFHYEYHLRLEEMKDAYAPFDPDADTRPGEELSEAERDEHAAELFERFVDLLQRCNFQRLTKADIEAATETASHWGVNLAVNFDVFDRLEVFARGDCVGLRSKRCWRNWLRLEDVEVPTYQRLAVFFRLADDGILENATHDDAVYVKFFKNIHKQDLEMLLPGTQVKMTLLDRTKIAFPTISGLGVSAYKATKLGLLAKLLKGGVVAAVAGGFWGVVGVVVAVCVLAGYALKSFFTYLTTKDKYHLSLTRSLYFQNLDNNAGVLFRLTDDAEEQECREAILAWFLLWRRGGEEGWSEEELDREAEAFLRNHAKLVVDFEHRDAIHNLRRLGLAEQTPQGKLLAPSPAECLRRLDYAWDHYFQHPPATAELP